MPEASCSWRHWGGQEGPGSGGHRQESRLALVAVGGFDVK